MKAKIMPIRERLLEQVAAYYEKKLTSHGPTPAGVDWNSETSQVLRFQQLLRILSPEESAGLISDYGCGYGAMADYLVAHHPAWAYCGFDISTEMIAEAMRLHVGQPRQLFISNRTQVPRATYTVASGIFNVKLSIPEQEWAEHVVETMDDLAEMSERGFAFNVLTAYSDPARRRSDLYYADPVSLFEHCRKRFSRHVALLHDYPLFEFTVLVRL